MIRKYIRIIIPFLVLTYSAYLVFDAETISEIGVEDGIVESLAAAFFLATSIIFFLAYRNFRNGYLLLLSCVMFMGFGEEISWGQRIFNFSTPDTLKEINVQAEFNIHNIEVFNVDGFNNVRNTGLSKLFTINFLYKLFWLSYCILLPIGCIYLSGLSSLVQKIRLPLPPLTIGIFFLVNWLIFRVSVSFFLPENQSLQYYDTIGEMQEGLFAFLFFMLGLYFYFNGPLPKNLVDRALGRQ